MLADLRLALRQLRRTPGFTLVAVLLLALGSGTVTAVWSVLDRTLLRPVTTEPDRWQLLAVDRGGGRRGHDLSWPLYTDLRDRAGVFDRTVAHVATSMTLSVGNDPERVDAAGLTPGSFAALGVPLALGRDIADDEGVPGRAAPVVVLSWQLWLRRFGGDPTVLGRSLDLNGVPYTVIGVAPEGFHGLVRGVSEQLWVPVAGYTGAGDGAFERRTVSWLDVLARRAPSVGATTMQAGLDRLAAQLRADSLLPAATRLVTEAGGAGLVGLVGDLRRPLGLLLAASGLVLLVAAANLAGLLLARGAARRRELAVRAALGASAASLGRLVAAEGVVLSGAGAGAGVLVASWLDAAAPALRTILGAPIALGPGVDLRLLGFTALLAILLAALVAVGPVRWAARLTLAEGLREGAPIGGRGGASLRQRLVVGQIALALVLLTGCLLLAVTARRLASVDPGYVADDVLLASVDLEARGYSGARAIGFWNEALDRLAAEPGVQAASLALTVTPSPGGMGFDQVPLEGSALRPEAVTFDVNLVGPGYFSTLRIPLLAGREFSAADRRGAPDVAVINREMARRYWGDVSPIGRRAWPGGDSTGAGTLIVGVVGDGKYRSLRESPLPVLYRSTLQEPPLAATLLVRGQPGTAPGALGPVVRRVVRGLDPGVPIFDLRPLADQLALARGTERLLAFLATLYAALAGSLSAVGLFGLLSYNVLCQRREIGVRVALGARPSTIRRRFVRAGLARAAWGIGLGLPLSLGAGRLLGATLFGVSPLDPLVLLGSVGAMVAVCLLASWWPAARAAAVDPMISLRSD